jgi:hypothetical protein
MGISARGTSVLSQPYSRKKSEPDCNTSIDMALTLQYPELDILSDWAHSPWQYPSLCSVQQSRPSNIYMYICFLWMAPFSGEIFQASLLRKHERSKEGSGGIRSRAFCVCFPHLISRACRSIQGFVTPIKHSYRPSSVHPSRLASLSRTE